MCHRQIALHDINHEQQQQCRPPRHTTRHVLYGQVRPRRIQHGSQQDIATNGLQVVMGRYAPAAYSTAASRT